MVFTDQHSIILHLSLIDGVGPGALAHIIGRMPRDLQLGDLYALTEFQFRQLFGVTQRMAAKVVEGLKDSDVLIKEVEIAQQHNITILTILDDAYPSLLKEIHLPPIVLYVQGASVCDENALAVIGARRADWYGKQAIDLMVPEFVAEGFAVVSGGAIGADSFAHQAAIAAGGKTIAVIGSGLLKPYPASNKTMFEKILQTGGSIVSPFPLLAPALPGNFPARNRIIAGLSRGCVVVQAAKKSGARITAEFALEQGRDVFAVPGPIDHQLSDGCHALIQDGAKLVRSAADVLEEYAYVVKIPQKSVLPEQCDTKTQELERNEPTDLLRWCAKPIALDDLVQKTGREVSELQGKLFELQLDGKLQQDFTGKWVRC